MMDENSEYDTVSIQVDAAIVAVACGVLPVVYAAFPDTIPHLVPTQWHQGAHVWMSVAAVAMALLGFGTGIWAVRRGNRRGLGKIGLLVNSVILLLVGGFFFVAFWSSRG
jgi:hypothetical protein